MPTYTETNANGMRKRVPLMEVFTEAFPERTPCLTAIRKKSGINTTSPESNSSKVEFPFKTFSAGENRGVNDTEDFDPATEAENNESNKTMLATRIQLIRNGVATGRITGAVTQQVAGPATQPKRITTDHKMDMLRRMRESKEKLLLSEAHCRPQTSSPAAPYMTDGFAGVMRRSEARPDLPTDAMAAPDAGQMVNVASAGDFTEATLNSMLATCWNARQTEASWHLFGHVDLQTVIDNFLMFGPQTSSSLPLRRVNMNGGDGKIDVSVKSYKSTFGTVDFSLNAKLPSAVTLTGCGTTNGSATLTVSSNAKLYPGMPVVGTGIPAGTRIAAVPSKQQSSTAVYLTANASATGTVSIVFGETVYGELWDFDAAVLGYLDEVGFQMLENRGGGERGYTDCLIAHCITNPQSQGIIRKTQSGFNGEA